jgi:CHAT domain-containing protein
MLVLKRSTSLKCSLLDRSRCPICPGKSSVNMFEEKLLLSILALTVMLITTIRYRHSSRLEKSFASFTCPRHSTLNLLVFSACLSGLGKATTGSECVGLHESRPGRGCQAHIGTLREVARLRINAAHGLFYRILKTNRTAILAEALRSAQLELVQLGSNNMT